MEEKHDRNKGCNCKHITIEENVLSDSLAKLKDKLEKLSPLSHNKCSIFRVPPQLRERKEKAFTPQVISIGPLHHNSPKLKPMEEHKMRYLKDFLSRTQASLEDCVQLLKGKEEMLRSYYADLIEFDSDKFIEIILVDATFILELFFRNSFGNHQLRNQHDHFFGSPRKLYFIKNDMILLENQVPFFIIEDLLSLAESDIPTKDDVRRLAVKLTCEFFRKKLDYLLHMDNFNVEGKLDRTEIHHFVHFARICYLPQEMPSKNKSKSFTMPTATQLHQAGVKFKAKKNGSIFDITFKDGVLEIPYFTMKDTLDILLRNLIAYEYCHSHDNYVNDYVFVLDSLVDTPGDVDLLTENGIIESKLSGSQEVASAINNLSPGVIMARRTFYFADLCEKLNQYYTVTWHKWRATLKEEYFSNPWAIISLIAAIMLLMLTFVQTTYAVMSYHY
ncbi:putative UPF0481 protein At3g02645 [Prosopis cineraria]|uniref:putative UPF0481 protein At3g02645 n=1 Tax=Prosopis cineraria TaxID=364024 RepID=UPI00240EC486|nr:putative UPF0481 protein At3g02645 [Prosopis cineraria]